MKIIKKYAGYYCIALVFVVCLFYSYLAFSSPSPQNSPYSFPRSVVYALQSDDAYASGVMIAPHKMLTVRHAVTDGEKDYKNLHVIANGKDVVVDGIIKDDQGDLALLEVDLGCPCIPMAPTEALQDTDAVIIGFPITSPDLVQVLSLARLQAGNDHTLYLEGTASPGNSGGGVFIKDKNGVWMLSGILRSILGGTMSYGRVPVYHLSQAVPVTEINRFLDSLRSK